MINQTWKYIITDQGAIIFPDQIPHAMVAAGFPVVYSAGFVKIYDSGSSTRCKVIGESTSTGLVSKPQDEQILNDLFVPLSIIKYFGFEVKKLYEKEKNCLHNHPEHIHYNKAPDGSPTT